MFAAVCLVPVAGMAQQSRIVGKIDNAQRITLAGHLHPRALPQYDRGAVDPNMVLPRVTVELQRSPAQQAALKQLLAEQQDPASPNYHKWLTPQQFADRFGASQDDINKIEQWLQSHNLTLISVAAARNSITVTGTAAEVEKVFGVEIHRYVINGQPHFANATNPSVPAAFRGVIGGIRGLNNFRLRPQLKSRAIVPRASNPHSTDSQGNHYLTPEDVANIYNLKPLYSGGLNGSGQKIVVVGQTDIRTADIDQFRSTFNLPAINLQQVLVPGSPDPGVIPPCESSTPASEECGDLSEADLDLELSGAVAPNATIIYVYADPNTTGGVETAIEYAIQQNLAPVISMSYGDCEYAYNAAQITSMQSLAQQANAQGITWFAASGDSGAADCYGDTFPNADNLISVDMPGSIPEVTAVGGTEFVDGNSNWNAANDANGGSALGYIPETGWNDSAGDGSPSASGGGASIYFSKPSWQTGTGVPNDGARDVPDIAISASADHDGYIIYSSDGCNGSRSTNTCKIIVGGTSVGAPQFSGMFTLVNQQLVASGAQSSPGLGNINTELYSLFQSSQGHYHDITTGNNFITITCPRFERGCTSGNIGFSAAPGYDQVTGIGTVDAGDLLAAWKANSSGSGGSGTGGGQNSTAAPKISAIVNAGSYLQGFAPGELVSVFGSQLAPVDQGASSVPLPKQMQGVTATVNNIPAYLDYVSGSQINLQIPYELTPGSTATLTINNNGSTVSTTFPMTAAAPGIFTDSNGAPVPNTSAAPGQTVTLFITGAGSVTPAINDGVAPPGSAPIGNLPTPTQSVTVTIGGLGGVAGLTAPTTFVGIPEGLVGVVQINYTIPPNAPLGPQPVVVKVGGVASTAATLTIQ
ncbi:MAG TPA: protease pro-enzyme activation domain-containing protein [Bryobacteraceae bacterium]